MKKCTRCGAENPDNRMWCISCKKSLLESPREPVNADLSSEESDLRGDLGKQALHHEQTVGGVGNHASGIPHWEETDNEQSSRLGGSLGKNRSGKSPDVIYCTSCGRPVPKGALHCAYCGQAQKHTISSDSPPKKPLPGAWRWIALSVVLAILIGLFSSIPISFRISKETEDTNKAPSHSVLFPAHFTDRKITDEASAREAIQDVSDILGINSVQKDLGPADRSEVLGDTYYRFQQMYEGIPVYGRSVVVSADADGNAQMLSSGYHFMSGISYIPKYTEAEALTVASSQYSSDYESESNGLVIFIPCEGKPELAWEIYCSGEAVENICFISAMNGHVLGTTSLLRTDVVEASGMDTRGNVFGRDDMFYCRSDEDGKYELIDDVRSIVVSNSNGFTLSEFKKIVGILDENNNFYQHKNSSWFDEHGSEVTIDGSEDGQFRITDEHGTVISENGTWAFNFKVNNPFGKVSQVISDTPYFEDKQAVTVMTRTEAVNDFYQEMFNRHGFDGEGGTTWAFYNDNKNWDNTNSYAHSVMGFPGAIIVFGKGSSLSDDLIAHEYTHNVQGAICDLTYSGESGALMEAYADICGELFEEWYTGTCDWIHDGGRSLKDPTAYITSDGTRYPSKYQGKNWMDPAKLSNDHGGVHTNCTVISHAAWLMTQPSADSGKYESLSTYDLAQLFYKALYGITNADITFSEFRSVLTYTAYSLCQNGQLTAKQVAMVDWAMSEAGIPTSLFLDRNGEDRVSIDRRAKLFVYQLNGALCSNYDLSITRLDTDTLPVEYRENLPRAESYYYSVREQDAFQIDLKPGIYEFTLIDPTGKEPSEIEYLRVVDKNGLAGYPFYPGFESGAEAQSQEDVRDHRYQIFGETLSWEQAKAACEAMGGHLATITSASEQRVIENLNDQEKNLWIGASCDGNGNWSWVTGEQWSYTNWNDGEPNNSSNVLPNENCAALWPKGWNDLANDNLYEQSGYICEWDSTDATVIQESLPGWFYCITVGGRADWKIMPENDGSFHSICVVWDWGDNGQGYSNGTGYITGITGVFSEVEKVNSYSYRMVADKIRKTQEAGDTYLSGDARYVVEEGTGITEGSEFYLFLPGTPRSELPQGLIDSVNNNGFHSMDEITPDTYILYNPIPDSNGYDLVFISTPEENNLQSQGAAAADRRLTSLTTYSQDGSIWYHHVFSWDENGNLIQVQEVEDPENIKSWTLQYNAQGQLLREDFSSKSYSCVNRQYTYDPNGKMLTGRVATEDGYGMLETTYHYDSSGRIFKIIQTDDYSRRETTVTDFNSQGNPTRREVVETVLSTGAQTYATEHLKYDNLGREIAWSYSGSDGEYSTTYRYDIKPFVVCTDAKGAYTLILNDADGDSCWTIDVGCNYTPLDNGVIDFQNMDADTGTLEVDQEGYLTRISFSNGEYFEFEYSSSSQSGAE